jgi:hypothetical protein
VIAEPWASQNFAKAAIWISLLMFIALAVPTHFKSWRVMNQH